MFRPDCCGLLQLQDNVGYPLGRALYIQFPVPVERWRSKRTRKFVCVSRDRVPMNSGRFVREQEEIWG